MIYPWQESAWQQLIQARRADRFPHALLITGQPGSGKTAFAIALSNALVCGEPSAQGAACGNCQSCVLFAAGNHPDFVQVDPEEEGKAIKIDQLRQASAAVTLHSHFGRFKPVIVNPAELMNRNAANSLLKTLEEPPPQSVFLLVSHQPGMLPITVRSRCQRLELLAGHEGTVKTWLRAQSGLGGDVDTLLRLADGAPLAALELGESGAHGLRTELLAGLVALSNGRGSPVNVAEQWSAHGASEVFRWLLKLLADVVLLRTTQDAELIVNRDLDEQLQGVAKRIDLRELFALYQNLLEFKQYLLGSSGLRERELLEDFTVKWVEASQL